MGECLIIKSGGLDTSDANATNDKVLQGYTCYVNDILITGTMVVYGTKGKFDTTMSAEDSRPVINIADGWPVWIIENRDKVNRICIPIPFLGVYDDHSYIGVEFSKIRQTVLDKLTLGTNATTDSIYTGVVGYVNGSRVVGTMPDNNAVSYMLPVNTAYWIPVGYHNGGGYVTQSVPLQGGWTITPSVNNIVACWTGHYTTGDIWCAGDANLVPWNIRKGYNIFGVTGTFSGWVDPTSERVIWPIASGHAPVTKSPTWLYYNPTSIHPESIRTRMVSVRDIQPYITGWNRLEFALYTSVTNWWTVYFYHLNGSLINTSHGSASTDSTLHINITFANLGIVTSSLSRIDLEMDNAGFGIDTLRLRYFI